MKVEEKVSCKGGLRGGESGTTSWTLVCLRAGLCHSQKTFNTSQKSKCVKNVWICKVMLNLADESIAVFVSFVQFYKKCLQKFLSPQSLAVMF